MKILFLCVILLTSCATHWELPRLKNIYIDTRGGTKHEISAKKFWRKAYKKRSESEREYIERLTKLIDDRMLLILPRYVREIGYRELCDSKSAIDSGFGYCSQHSIIFNNLCREQGIESFIVSLNIHVVNLVKLKNDTLICDPTFGIVFKIHDAYNAYLGTKLTKIDAKKYSNSFNHPLKIINKCLK